MTKDELDAIRARVDFNDVSIHDVIPLLAEVERLRDAHAMAVQVSGELCEKCGWAMKFPEEKCRCELLAEVERLTAEVESKVAQNVALIGQNGRLQQEVERLREATVREEDRVHRMVANAHLRGASETPLRKHLGIELSLLYGHTGFLGPCAHGSDPWDRCDECGEKTAVEAAAKKVEAQQQEIERLTAEREAAFQRGVAAMREAAAKYIEYPCGGGMLETRYLRLASEIRALPDPEDKP